jgi:threonine dehydratase
MSAILPQHIRSAETLIRPHIRRTPVVQLDRREFRLPPGPLTLKLELLQHSGSFKARGAFANMLLRSVPTAGVAAASGGNHGVAVAYAAQQLGHAARIFVPTVASTAKIERIRALGAELVITGDRYDDARAAAELWTAQSGSLTVHAYDQPETLYGQGSLALELQEQAPQLDTLLVAVGGGGLIGGIAAWYRNAVKVIAVEPETAPTLFNALRAGEPVDSPAGGIAADSLAPRRVGSLMFPIAQQFVTQSVLVTDDAIVAAQSSLWNTLRITAEPGGAAAMAALLSGAYQPAPDEHVGVVICGGNTSAVNL